MPPSDPSVSRDSDGLPPLPSHLDPRGKHRGTGTPSGTSTPRGIGTPSGTSTPRGAGPRSARWPKVRLGAKIVGAMLSTSLLLGFAYGWSNYHDLNGGLRRLIITGGKTHHDIDGKDQNILIVGNDDRSDMTNAEVNALQAGRDGGSLATDTMMIVHIPANGAKATLISLPRDAYVEIPDHGMDKLNSAYASAYTNSGGSKDARRAAGLNLLGNTISNLTGLSIDNYVQIDLLGFYRISNAIGGVSVNLCNAVNDPQYSHLVLPAGKHTLQGVTALEFVRQRHGLTNGDIDRVQRQRYFLTAAFRKIASAGTLLSPGRLSSLVSAIDKSIYVDGNLKLSTLAGQLSGLNANNIVGDTIPTNGFGTANGASILKVDPAEVKTFVNNLVGTPDSKLNTVTPLAPSNVTVDVTNAGSVDGAATTNAERLRQQGFVVATVRSSGQASPSTVIQYSDGMQAQAKTLASFVPGATLQKVPSLSRVLLLLGADRLTAKGKSSAAPTAHSSTPSAAPTPQKPIDAGCIN